MNTVMKKIIAIALACGLTTGIAQAAAAVPTPSIRDVVKTVLTYERVDCALSVALLSMPVVLGTISYKLSSNKTMKAASLGLGIIHFAAALKTVFHLGARNYHAEACGNIGDLATLYHDTQPEHDHYHPPYLDRNNISHAQKRNGHQNKANATRAPLLAGLQTAYLLGLYMTKKSQATPSLVPLTPLGK